MGIMSIYINWMHFFYAMAVVGEQEGDKVSYAKQEVFKVHPMKGRWRSEEQRRLESFLCLFAFHTASC